MCRPDDKDTDKDAEPKAFAFADDSQDTRSGEGDGVVAVCNYEGTIYYAGDSFPASDGCNKCRLVVEKV